ncbi:glycosyltransferase family 2 protein [Ancylobacter sp.]|uniref:glycosyltransferase family 2 protein n=1 Tax=Ancylobacter sp. TaxID=1872567 RepID=UPI003D0F3428
MIERTEANRSAERPLITVVMAVYREPAQMARCALRSVLDQTWSPFEIIIVNDSGLPRAEISDLAELDRRIRVIDHPENRGGAAAYNTGIDAARGELIAFIDADDVWYPNKLETQLDVDGDRTGCFFASNCMLVWKGGAAAV